MVAHTHILNNCKPAIFPKSTQKCPNSGQFILNYPCRSIYISSRDAQKDPYYVLGISKEAKMSEIKLKYFELAKKYHPDLNPDDENSR